MADPIAITISLAALAVSATTAWLTLFRKGTVRITQPTVFFFGPDSSGESANNRDWKIYFRALLFSTSKRGSVLESMHINLRRNESAQNFNVWVLGDEKLSRGSGLFVGESGVSSNHHFLLPKDGVEFSFIEGVYFLSIYAKIFGEKSARLLFRQSIILDRESADALRSKNAGVYFDWAPEAGKYLSHIDIRPAAKLRGGSIDSM